MGFRISELGGCASGSIVDPLFSGTRRHVMSTACEAPTPATGEEASSHGPCKCRNNVLSVEMRGQCLRGCCATQCRPVTNYRIGTWMLSTIIKNHTENNWAQCWAPLTPIPLIRHFRSLVSHCSMIFEVKIVPIVSSHSRTKSLWRLPRVASAPL